MYSFFLNTISKFRRDCTRSLIVLFVHIFLLTVDSKVRLGVLHWGPIKALFSIASPSTLNLVF